VKPGVRGNGRRGQTGKRVHSLDKTSLASKSESKMK
jgi:hypothetical protein